MSNLPFIIAQLRHLYAQMISGDVKDTAQAARGLLGPQIEGLERNMEKERPNAFFSDEALSKIESIGPWKDYPIGTKAFAIDGGHWTKTEHGWKWMEHGSTFPTPGANVSWVLLP